MYTKLTIQERIRDLRQEKKLTLEQLADATVLSKSALSSYESNETKDISHYAVIQLAKFYGVTTDYLSDGMLRIPYACSFPRAATSCAPATGFMSFPKITSG